MRCCSETATKKHCDMRKKQKIKSTWNLKLQLPDYRT